MSKPSYIAQHVSGIPRSGIRDFFEVVQSMADVISLGIGEPDFVTPWHIREAAIYAMEKGKTGYTSNLGSPALRKQIAKYVGETFSIEYDPATEILVSVGVSEALDLALRAIINPGDEILYHEPCYVSYNPSVYLAHGKPVAIPTLAENRFSLTAEAIRSAITPRTKAILINFPTNPTGAILTKPDLEAIAKVCTDHNLLVISDEIYAELTYDSTHQSIASLPGMRERTIFLHGFSKAFAMTGFRVGYACAPPEITDAMMRIHQYSMLCASIISQEAAREALANGKESMEKMREQYRLRRNFLVKKLEEMGLPCLLPEGAFYAFPNISQTGLTSKQFAMKLLEEEKVAAVPGTAFGPTGEGYLRCSYATSLEQIETATERMAAFLNRL